MLITFVAFSFHPYVVFLFHVCAVTGRSIFTTMLGFSSFVLSLDPLFLFLFDFAEKKKNDY